MAIRFKFRSSVNFDSLDIGGQPSISVRDLKDKIIRGKSLGSKDSDLVFSDAVTGREYTDPNFRISSGSSIIVKRVPAGSAPSAKVAIDSIKKFDLKDTSPIKTPVPFPVNVEGNNFDDFGVDLCPVPEVISYGSVEIDKVNDINSEDTNIDLSRFKSSEPSILRCEKLEVSDLSEAIPEGPTHVTNKGKEMQTMIKTEVEERMKSEQVRSIKSTAVQSTELPSELKCSLCNNFYKEAVMIPCCQHSFCKKCINQVLVEAQRCPKCSSTKCRVEDLLPNVSLRQAIVHFLESQSPTVGPDDNFHRYAPDGESGIQARDASCAETVHKRARDHLCSSSATRRGSNKMIAESTAMVDGSSQPVDINGAAQDWEIDDFQGENQLLNLPMHDEADSTTNKTKGSWVYPSGGNRSFTANDRHRKGSRSCYTCGSRDHLMRDCPATSAPFSRLHTGPAQGYMSTYWNGAPLPHMEPFQPSFGNPGMFPFNSTMLQGPPFAAPSYLPSMYSGMPVPGGIMRMGSFIPPIRTTAECSLSHLELPEQQALKKRHDLLNDNLRREQPSDGDDGFDKQYVPERFNFAKTHVERDKGVNNYEDCFAQKSHGKQPHDSLSGDDSHSVGERNEKTSRSSITVRDQRPYHSGRSRDSKKHDQRMGQGESESSRSRNQKRKGERSSDKRHNHRHYSHSDSGSEPSFSCDPTKHQKEEAYTHHGSRHSRHSKHEDRREDHHHHHHKRKRIH